MKCVLINTHQRSKMQYIIHVHVFIYANIICQIYTHFNQPLFLLHYFVKVCTTNYHCLNRITDNKKLNDSNDFCDFGIHERLFTFTFLFAPLTINYFILICLSHRAAEVKREAPTLTMTSACRSHVTPHQPIRLILCRRPRARHVPPSPAPWWTYVASVTAKPNQTRPSQRPVYVQVRVCLGQCKPNPTRPSLRPVFVQVSVNRTLTRTPLAPHSALSMCR